MNDKQQLFLAFADKSMNRPTKARIRAVEKRRMHRAQEEAVRKALAERDMLMRLWKKWREEVLTEALAGAYAQPIEDLIHFLEHNKLEHLNRQLVKWVEHGPWLKAPADIRFLVLRLINARITKLREKQDLPPFDDPLPGQPLSPFLIIRNNFMGLHNG